MVVHSTKSCNTKIFYTQKEACEYGIGGIW